MPRSAEAYDAYREQQAELSRQASRDRRDIAPMPPIANVRRRGRCRNSLRFFCETYNPAAFALGWSADHLDAIARIEEAVRCGALYAFAMSRGQGKSTIVRHAALWAISYAHCRYVFCVGANAPRAEDTLASIQTFVRFLPRYGEDFPEIAYPVRRLEGIARRANGQLYGNEPTMLEWSAERLVFPTVSPPANWPRSWPLRDDGKAPTSGSVVSSSGLTGDGIRGSVLTLTNGELLRPDLVLLDDPQTPESARSPSQNFTREQLVAADLLGLAGPGKPLSAVMPCTVIAPGDMVDSLLDQEKHPLWRGERRGLLRSMPTNLAAWEQYFEVYARCARKRPPDHAEANALYIERRAELDAGAEASWDERKLPTEVSAIQSAMHLYFRDKRAFFSEYQNSPLPLVAPEPGELKADEVAARLNRTPRGVAPPGSTRLTAMVDVQQNALYYAVCAWKEDFGGSLIDWGCWPPQRRAYFAYADVRPTLGEATGVTSVEGAIYAGLTALADQLLSRGWDLEGGGQLRIEKLLVDAGWQAEVIRRWARQTPHAATVMPSKGMPLGAAHVPMSDWPRQPGERRGQGWVLRPPKPGEGRLLLFDANGWKSTLAAKLRQPLGEASCFTLFGTDPVEHRLLCDHITSEYKVRTFGRGREVEEWKLRPSRPDNHAWDALVGCCVAASFLGVQPAGIPPAPKKERRKVSYAEAQQRAKGAR